MSLQGALPVVPTPFLDGEIDYDSIDRMIEHTLESVDGYTVAGSTGEAPALRLEEKKKLTEYFCSRLPEDKTVVVGVGDTNADRAVELANYAAERGAGGVLIPSPYYFPNSLESVEAYLGTVDRNVDIEMVFYDNPVTTKTQFSAPEIIDLLEQFRNLNYVKMTDHDIPKIKRLKQHGSVKGVFAGDDVLLYRMLLAGCDGCMVIAPAIYPQAYRRSWQLLQDGELEQSFRLFSEVILPFIHMFGIGDEIATTKRLYADLGIFSEPDPRPPLTGITDEYARHVMLAYRQGTRAMEEAAV